MRRTTCPGCGIVLSIAHEAPESHFNSSRECWQLFCKLSEATAAVYDEQFIHQLAIDTYESQHAGGNSKPITAVFGLIGLYLTIEKNYSGRQVQHAHITLANRNKDWPVLHPPTEHWGLTVGDVYKSSDYDSIVIKIRQWASVTWQGWRQTHSQIIELVEKYLYK